MSGHAFTIRVATGDDLPQIVALMNAAAVGARASLETDDMTVYAAAFKEIEKAPEADIFVAVDSQGTVLSTYQLTLEKGLAFQGRPRATVESMHTRADQRGKGIGRAMIAHAKQTAAEKGCCMVQLTSNAQRVDAHRFYLREGFEQSHLGFKLML
ncbi:GNAT family N-acetyltransferase [Pseudovibrio sp. SPO723]|uniref:GNAT family N-acetyltransferase n=1 Tax=Nesiotobacter zosterae TaxID=392721 RepID=UPI0029C2ED6E|nr:GNAT family N-acetyltransferase [Pseudovibrio sp. SPO723]MDX5594438.1 GNAT family N-acetyltransferase [Pseudovibrio sp. SPO723]